MPHREWADLGRRIRELRELADAQAEQSRLSLAWYQLLNDHPELDDLHELDDETGLSHERG
jgi:hypothetical protein